MVIHDDQRQELLRTSLEEANRLNRMVGNLWVQISVLSLIGAGR